MHYNIYSHKTASSQPLHSTSGQPQDSSSFDEDDVTSSYYRQNSTSPGRILYTVSYYELL